MLNRSNLHAYQVRAVDFIKENKTAALWIDMGLGKTVSTLTAIADLIEAGDVKKTLVIAPLRVAKFTWPDEIKLWSQASGISYTVLAGLSSAKREAALSEPTDIHLINRENIPWLVEHFGQKWPYDFVVIDESSSFKSHTSKRWKALRKVLGKIRRMVQLTGTPAPNSLMELWPQMYLLDKGTRLENTRGKFLTKYCTLIGNPAWNQWGVKPDRAEAIYKRVADVVLRMSAEEYLELPPRIDVKVEICLPPKARKAYEDMKRDFILMHDKGEVLAVNAAVQINKLLQVANGNIYDENAAPINLHTAKLEALEDIIDSSPEPVLVAYNFKSDLSCIQKRFPQAEILGTEENIVKRWNAGEIPVLLAHPASAGHGLNLQKGGSLIVWYGLSWSLELYQQFNARLHRQGQCKPVRIVHLMASDTADEVVLAALSNKEDTQDTLLRVVDALRNQNG